MRKASRCCRDDKKSQLEFEEWGIEDEADQIGDVELLDALRANFEAKMAKTKKAVDHWKQIRMKLLAFVYMSHQASRSRRKTAV